MLLGLLLIIAIVIYYASFGFAPVPGVGEEKLMVQEMLEGIITSGTEIALEAIELQGGYIIPPNESVTFNYIGVPLWQICQNDLSPGFENVTERLERTIMFYVNNHIQGIRDFFGKNLSIGNATRVDVNIVDKKVDVAVYMPTRFEGQAIRQPYRISVPTNLKQLLDFANDTITEMNRDPTQGGSFFETFTIASLYKSRYLPTFGIMTECGESIFLTPQDVSEYLEVLAAHTIAHTKWWEESSHDFYGINFVNGKQYRNLRPRIVFPDGFKVNSPTSIQLKNDQWLAKYPIPIRICLSTYNIKYSFGYPIVISLNDSETGYDFNFAVYVNVKDMRPGDCDAVANLTTEDPCADPQCDASIRVEDCSGNPLYGTRAYFGGCPVGTSDSTGMIQGKVRCGSYDLFIQHSDDYDYFSGTVSSGSLAGATYRLCRVNDLTVQFNELEIIGHIGDEVCHPCGDPTDCASAVDWTSCEYAMTSNCAFVTFKSTETGNEYVIVNNDPDSLPDECSDEIYFRAHPDICMRCSPMEVSGFYIPSGNYDVTTMLWDPATYKYMGYLRSSISITELATRITVNVPNFGIPTNTPETQNSCGIQSLRNSCGIEPLVVT